jgi:hypothetical protein
VVESAAVIGLLTAVWSVNGLGHVVNAHAQVDRSSCQSPCPTMPQCEPARLVGERGGGLVGTCAL